MTKTLIRRLSELQHLTPDEIVSQLSSRGWFRPRDMTEEYWYKNQTVPHVYWLWGDQYLRGCLTGGQHHRWYFTHCDSRFERFKRTLDNGRTVYWLIPLDKFDEKVPPPCPS